jgi:hypothetical protein
MTLTLELPGELEADLSAEAARLGLSLPEYVLRVLSAGRLVAPAPRNGKELVAYWEREGLLGTRPDITDSAQHARDLRSRAERRSRS